MVVVGVALLAGVGGMLVGTQVRSPADEAASRSAPVPSRITVPVERQVLESSLVLSGEVQFNEPVTVKLAGAVGVPSDEAQVITQLPEIDTVVQEGDVALEASGRPVFFLQGALPMYRRMVIGTQGPDVLQLEESLVRLGLSPGVVDNVFDQATADAVSVLYTDSGYVPEGPNADQREQLRLARASVTVAEQQLRDANAALADQSQTARPSEILQLRQAVETARAAVPRAQQTATNDNNTAAAMVTAATTERDAARVLRDAAVAARDAANVAGAIDPNTGEAYTAATRSQLTTEAATAEQALAAAEVALTTAVNQQPVTASNGAAAVTAAQNELALAEAQLREANAPADTTARREAVNSATQALDEARADLAELEATAGLRIAAGEIVFLPILPSTVTQVFTSLGGAATEQLLTVATSETLVVAAVSRADSSLVQVGADVNIELRDTDIDVPGTVVSIGQPPTENEAGSGGGGDGGSSGSGRLQVVIAPSDATALNDFVFFGARVRLAVASTDGEVLVVPVSALSVGPGGSSRVEVETRPVTPDDPGATEVVEVEVGLSAQGLTEIRPTDGGIEAGDRVVVGVETNERRNESDEPTD
jgi:multidrug efflux pump subunit AcrA (membrane-fusion protein)